MGKVSIDEKVVKILFIFLTGSVKARDIMDMDKLTGFI